MKYTMTVEKLRGELDALCKEGKGHYRATFRTKLRINGAKYQPIANVKTVDDESLAYMNSESE